LIAAGQSSTITGTLAGQIVMEGYLNLRIQPWIRRLLTRIIAIVPAFIAISYFGEQMTGKLLILSQVILSLQLGFAIIPLIHFVSDRAKMGEFAIGKKIQILAWICAVIIVGLNVKLVFETILNWLNNSENSLIIYFTIVPIALLAAAFLLYIIINPFLKNKNKFAAYQPHETFKTLKEFTTPDFKKIAIAVDFSETDKLSISHAIAQGGKNAAYLLIHIEETVGALVFGKETDDLETETDLKNLKQYAETLNQQGFRTQAVLGYGNPKKSIPKIVTENKSDLLIMGAHGHKGWKDLLFGTTVDAVRHRVTIPVFIVRK